MKKLLLLFIGITVLSCSSDDAPSTSNPPATNTVQVITHSYNLYESTQLGKRFDFVAVVKNNKTTSVNGMVKFDIANDQGGNTFVYIEDVTVDAGETKTLTGHETRYFPSETLNISSVTFVESE